MSAGFYLVSGMLYVNLGCEAMFVLANRMRAQNVQMKTGSKILCDITLTLLKPSFIQVILKPQTPYTIPTFYEIFNKIINCSIMKLDKNSMEKLFYLILMTFKRQMFLLSSPLQLYSLTIIHLQDLLTLQKDNPQAKACIEQSLQLFKTATNKLSYLHYLQIREQILSMLESYKSKIVLFCQNGSQDQSGCLVFIPRNIHNRKNIGMTINHVEIQFPNNNQWGLAKNYQYQSYKNWKSNLGKDDYDNIRGSSKMSELKPKSNKNLQEDNLELSDILGIKNIKFDNFEVHLDIFSNHTTSSKITQTTKQKKQSIKTISTNQSANLHDKINKQFEDLNIDSKKQAQEELDLLDLMDS